MPPLSRCIALHLRTCQVDLRGARSVSFGMMSDPPSTCYYFSQKPSSITSIVFAPTKIPILGRHSRSALRRSCIGPLHAAPRSLKFPPNLNEQRGFGQLLKASATAKAALRWARRSRECTRCCPDRRCTFAITSGWPCYRGAKLTKNTLH